MQFYAPLVDATEDHYDLPEGSLGGLIDSESTWDPYAVSFTGAAGLGQLTAKTARSLGLTVPDGVAEEYNHWRYHDTTIQYVEEHRSCPSGLVSGDERFDPRESIRGTASYLDGLLERSELHGAIRSYKGVDRSHSRAEEFIRRFEDRRAAYSETVEEDSMYRAEYAKHRLWLDQNSENGGS